MQYQITRLDRRHSHHERFAYMIEFSKSRSITRSGTGALDFDRARRWFNETYGWSQEADLQTKIDNDAQNLQQAPEANTHWAYHAEYRNFRIYANAPETAWFQLKFPNNT
jgi:hypothetical protein